MARGFLRLLVLVVVAAVTWLLEALALVIAAGEVSCYEVCSPVWELVDRYEPWPTIAGLLVAIWAGWGASLLVGPG